MKTVQQIALAAGFAVILPVVAMAQDGGQVPGQDIGSRLLAELTGQLDLSASHDLRSDSRRTYGQTGAQAGDKTTPALAGAPNPPDRIAQLPQPAPQRPQTGRVQQVAQTLPPPPPPVPMPASSPMLEQAEIGKGMMDAEGERVGGKPQTVQTGPYGY